MEAALRRQPAALGLAQSARKSNDAVEFTGYVADAVLQALKPAAFEATLQATQQLESDHDAALAQWCLAVERASYEAQRAERRYRAVDPENRLVARGLEATWEQRLRELEQAQAELASKKSWPEP